MSSSATSGTHPRRSGARRKDETDPKELLLGELISALAHARSPTSTLSVVLTRIHVLFAPLRAGELYLAHGTDDFQVISFTSPRRDLLTEVRNTVPLTELGTPVRVVPSAVRDTYVLSVPILADLVVMGLILLEREQDDFDDQEIHGLTRIAEQIARLLQRQPSVTGATSRRYRRPSSQGDRPIDRRVANRARLTSNGLPSYGRRASDRRLGRDMSLARGIQELFLPKLPHFFPTGPGGSGFQLAAEYHPAYVIGGDFYDFVRAGEHRFVAGIGDVSGKGVAAAMVMSRRQADFRRLAESGLHPGEMLDQLNALMVDEGHDAMFATVLCLEVDTDKRSLAIANAGHVPAVQRTINNDLRFVGIETNAPLGIIGSERYATHHFQYEIGDIVVLMTDGVSDALDPSSTLDHDSPVLSTVSSAEHNVEYLVPHVLQAARDVQTTPDDLTLLALQLS